MSQSVNVAQVTTSASDITISTTEYNELRAANKPASTVTFVAQSGNHVAFVSQFSFLGPWILDFGASNHMIGTNLFSLPSLFQKHPQIKVRVIEQTHPLPQLSLNFVLFVPGCPFNLISISKLTALLIFLSGLLIILFLYSIDAQDK